MKQRVLLIINGKNVVAINRTALQQPGGALRLMRELAVYTSARRAEFDTQRLLPRMPAVCS